MISMALDISLFHLSFLNKDEQIVNIVEKEIIISNWKTILVRLISLKQAMWNIISIYKRNNRYLKNVFCRDAPSLLLELFTYYYNYIYI